MVCNTDNQENAIKYLDWLFTDEATWLVSWGIEGETFEMVDDRPQPILDDGETVAVKYGIGSDGLALRRNGNDFGVDGLKEYVDAVYASEDIEQEDYNPIIFLKYTPQQQEVVSTVGTEIETYVQETISKFLVGEKDFSEWDSYVAEVESMGLDEYLAVLTEAYDAVK
jgi:putative aldouronate transport system substrate-binding protein